MAISGKNAQYRIHDIQRRHWSEQAARIGLGALAGEEIVAEVLQQAPAVVESVYGQLPADFPMDLADSILKGILWQSERLAHMPAA